MTAPNAAALGSLADWIEGRLSDEHADRQTICEDVAAQVRDMAAALRAPAPPVGGRGPFETERQAADAARHIYDSPHAAWRDGSHRLLENACTAAGMKLGAYDHRILLWLTTWEPATCAVIAGLISRAHRTELAEARAALLSAYTAPAAELSQRDAATAAEALETAAEYRRFRASLTCEACAQHPAELCEGHAADLDRADEYDRLSDLIRKASS